MDTNVIVSALNFAGKPAAVFDLAVAGEIDHITSEPVLAETKQVLREKFSWKHAEGEAADALLRSFSQTVQPRERLAVIADDPDNRILECAVEAQADFIISGDKHLLELQDFRGTKTVTPTEFLEILP